MVYHPKQANVQATVDHEGYFTSYDIGWPASVTDIQVFKRSKIWSERAAHFHADEYLLADKGNFLCRFREATLT